MISACQKQCKVCPFRPDSLPSWLGSYSHTSIHQIAWFNQPFFCHDKIDYEDEKWLTKAEKNGKVCRGFLKFANEIMSPKRVDDRYPAEIQQRIIDLRKTVEGDTDTQTMKVMEFIEWHDPKNSTKNMEKLLEMKKVKKSAK